MLNGDGQIKLLTMNPMEKQITKMNKKLENMTYLVDNKKICFNIKIAPVNKYNRKMDIRRKV